MSKKFEKLQKWQKNIRQIFHRSFSDMFALRLKINFLIFSRYDILEKFYRYQGSTAN